MKKGLFLTILMIVLTGCIKIPLGDDGSLKLSKDGITVTDKDGKDTTIKADTDDGSFSMSSNEGEEFNMAFGDDLDVPEDFPVDDLPIPKDAKIVSSQKTTTEDGSGEVVIYVYEGIFNELAKFYESHFEKSGYEAIETGSIDSEEDELQSGMWSIKASKNDTNFAVTLIGDSEEVNVTLFYGTE